jgi:SAM-dependent methyltransferase
MQQDAYRLLAQRQDAYWWHRARRLLSRLLLRRFGLPGSVRWLDIGCGPGGNLDMLAAWRPELAVGIDLSPLALTLARQGRPQARLIRADINHDLPFADATFGLVTIFNVLYHDWVASDLGVLREAARVLRPGGLLLVTEPAFPLLRRELDVAVMTRRRYRGGQFDALLRQAGFTVLFGSYVTSFGLPLLLAARLLRRRCSKRPPADMRPLSAPVNTLLLAAAAAEARAIAAGLAMPFGTTLVRVCRPDLTGRPSDTHKKPSMS